jgi:HAMP domain-containing protein
LQLELGPPAGRRQLIFGINTRYEREGLLLQMLGFAGLILAALLVIGLIFILFFRRLVERPLLTLTEAFQQSEPGAPAQAVIDRQDEIGQLAVSYNEMARQVCQTNHQIREQEAALQCINRNFGDSVIYASQIQRRLLPKQQDLSRHLGENALLWQPKDTVGGDLLWAGSKGSADFLFFFDCTGHGVPGAMMTTITIGVIDRLMKGLNSLPARTS